MEDITKTTARYVNLASMSPLPAWALSASLLSKGLGENVDPKLGSVGSSTFSKALAKPTKASCLTFGAAHALGGYIIYDDDISNGSGFTFAWSTLYLLVNGRPSIKSFFHGRISPVALSVLALGNAGIYGKQFFWPSS